MANKINISIPQPCHENWQEMTTMDKGRFCNSCQKKVYDFTSSSDREIINAFDKNNNLCGRFLNTQLNRDLIKPKEKSSLWLATTTALISLVGLNEVAAQETLKTEQTDKKVLTDNIKFENENVLVSGIVYDENKTPIPNLSIYIKGNKVSQTNSNGNFSFKTHLKARIEFRNADEEDNDATEYYVRNNFNNTNIEINAEKFSRQTITSILGGISVIEAKEITITNRLTFLGRIFHSIGNWFK